MLKCLFSGHRWTLVTTQTWSGVDPQKYHDYMKRDYAREIYRCEKCGLWRSKLFVEHILKDAKMYSECPVPQEELK